MEGTSRSEGQPLVKKKAKKPGPDSSGVQPPLDVSPKDYFMNVCVIFYESALLEQLSMGLLFPDEGVKASVCYIYGKLYSLPSAVEKLTTHFTEKLCSLFLSTLENAQSRELQINCLGLLKQLLNYNQFVSILMNQSGSDANMEDTNLLQGGNPLPLVLKKLLLSRDETLQTASVQSVAAILSYSPVQYASAFIDADIPEFLFERLSSTDEVLVWSVYSCLILLTEERLFFTKCHTLYGIESLIRSLKETLALNNMEVQKQGLLLLTKILQSCHPRHTIHNIPGSQFQRVRRICSNESLFDAQALDLKTRFIKRGYNKTKVDRAYRLSKNGDRIQLLLDRETIVRSQNEKSGFVPTEQPVGIKLFTNLTTFKDVINTLKQGVNYPSLVIATRSAKAVAIFLRKEHLSTPVLYKELQLLVEAVLMRCSDFSPPVSSKRHVDYTPGREKSKVFFKQGQYLFCALEAFNSACRLALECQSDPSVQENAFAAPRTENEDNISNFATFLLRICDSFCIPTVMKHCEGAADVAVMEVFFSILNMQFVIVPCMKEQLCVKLASSSFIRLTLELKANFCSGQRNPGLNEACSKFLCDLLCILYSVFGKGEHPQTEIDEIRSLLQTSVGHLNYSFSETLTLLSEISNTLVVDEILRNSQYALLFIFFLAYAHQDRLIQETQLVKAICNFLHSVLDQGDTPPTYIIKAILYLLSLCQEKCDPVDWGFQFVPNRPLNMVNTLVDVKLFLRKLNLKLFFKEKRRDEQNLLRSITFNPPLNPVLRVFEEVVEQDIRKMFEILNDEETYSVASKNEIHVSCAKIQYYLKGHLLQGAINKKLYDFLYVEKPRIPVSLNITVRLLESIRSFSTIYIHHPVFLKFFFCYSELTERFGSIVLDLWFLHEDQSCSETERNTYQLAVSPYNISDPSQEVCILLSILKQNPDALMLLLVTNKNLPLVLDLLSLIQLKSEEGRELDSIDFKLLYHVSNLAGRCKTWHTDVHQPAFNYMYCSLHRTASITNSRAVSILLSNTLLMELLEKILASSWTNHTCVTPSSETLLCCAWLLSASLLHYQHYCSSEVSPVIMLHNT
ncbi:meiosis inhibitor protein 1 [Protopterus annectens]|uniref:meiosis inhibitor protein 1 n=1 Tax=Protopterus annectens TaxID=7888 RepID=UPI001CFA1408|nr:meiosis inhibitor protein 1 [Protopterus annectens]